MNYKKIIRRLQIINAILIVLLLMIGGTFAIYTSQVYQRAVVRNRYNDVIRFSSDKLYRVSDTSSPQKYYYPLGENQTVMNFAVCNYDQTKSTLYNEKDIQYNISFSISKGTVGDYSIKCGGVSKTATDGQAVTFDNQILQANHKSVDTYSVQFHPEDFGKVEIAVTVTPSDLTVTQNNKLSGILVPIEYATTQGARLEWSYPDSNRGTPQEFDAYNLLVTLSGGSGNILITWNYEELDIDSFFASGKTTTINDTDKTKTISVPMNSEDDSGTYLISFFNHKNTRPSWTKWKKENESDNGYIPIKVELDESSLSSSD